MLHKEKDIQFILFGDGQTKSEIDALVQKNEIKNIKMPGLVSIKELQEYIRKSHLCLGIFSSNSKAQKVVTNKVFQILASKKPLITMV